MSDNASSSEQVLIVDSCDTSRRSINTSLRAAGYAVAECSSASECFERCKASPPQLVLLNTSLSNSDPLALCRELREQHARERMPILLVTASSSSPAVLSALSLGANDFVMHPGSSEELLMRVASQIEISQLHAQLRQQTEALACALERQQTFEKSLMQHVKFDAVGLFAHGVAHNMNNIFGSILGAAEVLARVIPQQERVQRCVEIIRQGVENGRRLTKRMLWSDARADAEQRLTSDALREVVLQVVEVQKAIVGNDRISFRAELAEHDSTIRISPADFANILTNLLSNAVDSIAQRGTIHIRGRHALQSGKFLLEIEDTGRGIPRGDLARVFEPFFSTKSLDHKNKVSTLGHGLGMWLVFQLIRSAGGEIAIESELGRGTLVRIELPAQS